ncbi:zinc ribbon domain-containing protein [bacterium]|nr:zinc ribbon domain-containing protein [bacterium]
MICPKCAYQQPDGSGECLRCGVIFAKVRENGELPLAVAGHQAGELAASPSAATGALSLLKEKILSVEAGESRLLKAGRAALFLVLVVWGLRLMSSSIASNYVGESFLHLVNLPFHEAGHIIFAPFGRFVQVLGGTLGQWLVPLIVLIAFVLKNNPFGGSVALWWLGESFLDIAPYMDDARAGQLLLLGGVTGSEVADYHDWEVILSRLGWLPYDHLIARISFCTGVAFMLCSFLWGGYILWRQYRSSAH